MLGVKAISTPERFLGMGLKYEAATEEDWAHSPWLKSEAPQAVYRPDSIKQEPGSRETALIVSLNPEYRVSRHRFASVGGEVLKKY